MMHMENGRPRHVYMRCALWQAAVGVAHYACGNLRFVTRRGTSHMLMRASRSLAESGRGIAE